MVRYCVYHSCKSREKKEIIQSCTSKASNTGTVCFYSVPKPTTDYEKCLRWLRAINRTDIQTTNVKKHHYVCSKHFVGGFGPSINYPDPLPDYEGCPEFVEQQVGTITFLVFHTFISLL